MLIVSESYQAECLEFSFFPVIFTFFPHKIHLARAIKLFSLFFSSSIYDRLTEELCNLSTAHFKAEKKFEPTFILYPIIRISTKLGWLAAKIAEN